MTTYSEINHVQIEQLLVGHKVTKVSDDTLTLDDGTKLTLAGNTGGCSCGAGDYELSELNGCDNIITKVEFIDQPGGDDMPSYDGLYQIVVYAENRKINLATFTGGDGNGYYGTGYTINVLAPKEKS